MATVAWPKLPVKLILKILSMNLNEPSDGIKRHTNSTTLNPFVLTKWFYKNGQALLKKEGSWRLHLNMHRAHVCLVVPPAWISDSITKLALTIHAKSCRFSDAQVEIIQSQLREIRHACPQLSSIFITLRVPPYNSERTMRDMNVNPNGYFLRIVESLAHNLPEKVEFRAIRLSTHARDPPTSKLGISALASIPKLMLLANDTAFYMIPKGAKWVDWEPESGPVDIPSLLLWAGEFQQNGLLHLTHTVNVIDASKRSPRVPYELIFKILAMTLPFESTIKGHTRPSMIYPFMACKQLYRDAKRLLKKRGSWWLECDLRGSRLQLRTPPKWIAESITTLSLLVYTPNLRFFYNTKVDYALFTQILAIRKTCPRLRSIILLHRPTIIDANDAMNLENHYLHHTEEHGSLLGWLPETVTRRAVWIQDEGTDAEPEFLSNRAIGSFHYLRVLGVQHKTALSILPPHGRWTDRYIEFMKEHPELPFELRVSEVLSEHWTLL